MCMPAQSCPTLCNPKDCSPPGSSVFGIFQVRTLEWVAISSSRESSQPKDQTLISSYISRWILYHWATQGSPYLIPKSLYYIALFYSIWANLDCSLLSMHSFFCVSYFIPQIRFIYFSNSFICLASSYSCFKTQSKLFIIWSLALCKGCLIITPIFIRSMELACSTLLTPNGKLFLDKFTIGLWVL